MRNLISNGQFQFTLGHWVMPDEAITDYKDLIYNAEIGMQFLENTFGECGRPLVGWQIDPFGHSIGTSLMYKYFNFDALFLGRVTTNDYDVRFQNQELEFMWNDVFTSINGHNGSQSGYYTPQQFHWDSNFDSNYDLNYNDYENIRTQNTFIQDDEELEGFNLDQKISDFVAYLEGESVGYSTNNLLVTFGGDFDYKNANQFFDNIDKLIKYTNEMYGDKYNLIYSNPACYAKAAKETRKDMSAWPIYSEKLDFFPYNAASDITGKNVSFWSGFYSSRPLLKQEIRLASSDLNICKQFELAGIVKNNVPDKLQKAVALAQHHDAITGTEKYFVVEDYSERLRQGSLMCDVNSKLENDETYLYNSLSFSRTIMWDSQLITLPALGWLNVKSSKSEKSQNFNIMTGSKVSKVVKRRQADDPNSQYSIEETQFTNEFDEDSIGNELIRVTFKPDGEIQVFNTESGLAIYSFLQIWLYYESSPGDSYDSQSSGAYVFRPLNDISLAKPCIETGDLNEIQISKIDDLTMELKMPYEANYITYSYTLENDQIILNYEITEMPVDEINKIGKELISRFNLLSIGENILETGLEDGNYRKTENWYSDSNGYSFVSRDRSIIVDTAPTSSRYFPIISQCYFEIEQISKDLKEDDPTEGPSSFELTLDRAAGAASLFQNELEVMLHRRTLVDDNKGLNEPMNYTATIKGQIYLNFYKTVDEISRRRKYLELNNRIYEYNVNPTQLIGQNSQNLIDLQNNLSFLKNDLPSNVIILSLAKDLYFSNVMIIKFECFWTSINASKSIETEIFKLDRYFSFSNKTLRRFHDKMSSSTNETQLTLNMSANINRMVDKTSERRRMKKIISEINFRVVFFRIVFSLATKQLIKLFLKICFF